MVESRSIPIGSINEPVREEAHHSLLRYIDRAALDQLLAVFREAVDLPAAILDPWGDVLSGELRRCPACVAAGDELDLGHPGGRPEGSGCTQCRHGQVAVIIPIADRAGEPIGAVHLGPADTIGSGNGARPQPSRLRGQPADGGSDRGDIARRGIVERVEAAAKLLAETLVTVVREAEIASEHAQLVATQRQANRELTVLYAVSRALSSGTALQAILQQLVDSVGELIGADAVVAWLVEDQDLVTVASRGLLSFEARHRRLRIGEGLAGRVAATGTPLACRDMQEDPRQVHTALNSREDLHAFAGVPLVAQGVTAGVLAVYRRIARDFPEAEIQLLAHIADQAAVAMERARLFEHERHTVAELRQLHARIEAQHRALERATAVHAQLTELVLHDAGLEAIVEALSRALEASVAVEDQFRHRLTGTTDPIDRTVATADTDGEMDRVYDAARDSRRPIVSPMRATGVGQTRIVAPVIVGGDLLGFLTVVERERALAEPDLLAVGHAATVVALEMMKQRTRAEVERRLRGELLDELVAREPEDPEAIQRRAAYLGYNLGMPHALLLFVAHKSVAIQSGLSTIGGSDERKALAAEIAEAVTRRGRGFMVLPRLEAIYVAAPLAAESLDAARALAEELRREASVTIAGRVSVGMGRLCLSPQDFAVSATEAQRALGLANALGATDRVIAFDDLGVYQLLLDLPRPSDAVRFAERTLAPLETYDADHGTCLVATLEAFLAANGVLQHAAAAMSVHVNTLAYRLQRIRELLDVDLQDSDARLGLHMAVKIRHTQRVALG